MWLIPASMEESLDDVFVVYFFFLLFLSITNGGFAIVSSAIKWYIMLAIMTRLRLGPYNPAIGRDAGHPALLLRGYLFHSALTNRHDGDILIYRIFLHIGKLYLHFWRPFGEIGSYSRGNRRTSRSELAHLPRLAFPFCVFPFAHQPSSCVTM